MLNSIEFRYVHSIPAFAAALLSGALSLGALQGVSAALSGSEIWQIPFGAGLYAAVSILWIPVLGLVFFPLVLLLRLVHFVNWLSFLAFGVAVGYSLSFQLPTVWWSSSAAGGVGGLVAFFTIQACANRDALST